MGSLPRPPRLTEAEIVARYRAGEGRGMIGLRAGIADHKVKAILEAAGVPLRTSSETLRLACRARMHTLGQAQARRRARQS